MFQSIIKKYFVREISKSFAAVFIVIFLILLSTQVLRVLSAVSDGKITLDLLFVLLGLTNIKSLAMIVPVIFYLAILLSLSRFYEDSEMVAMSACGISPATVISALTPLLLIFFLVELLLAIFISPWANAQITHVKKVYESNADVDLLEAGRFNLFSGGKRVVYTEDINQNKQLKRVFLYLQRDNTDSVIYAEGARIIEKNDPVARYIVFQKGTRYDGVPGSGDYRIINFEEYGVLVEDKLLKPVSYDWDELSFGQLMTMSDSNAVTEIQWRISLVISGIILALIAVPISHTAPRRGRFARLLPAILIYFFYTNLLSISQNLLKKDQLPPYIGLWWVHLLFFLIFIYLFARQMGWLTRKVI